MPAGEAFSERQRDEIVRAIEQARVLGDLRVSVYVGELPGDSRAHALKLHGALDGDPADALLIAVDPGARRLEIVTGADVRRRLDDRTCKLATLTMTSAFALGDLSGGIADGMRMLTDHARTPPTLHTEVP
ncbi:MAG: DUF5130 domain-containing protein [Actinomycetota bacterium]|nr:DUF5130 domain-containing protein [Actinomycetota bacterium]